MALSPQERIELLSLARKAVESAVTAGPPPTCEQATELMNEQRGCFVTLKNGDRLRGCIGQFVGRGPLWQNVVEMGVAAAADPRFVFDPITPAELPQLTVEVSVLSPLRESENPLEEIELGTHGIYIVGPSSGCFLPEVATEQGWSARQFLDHCCASKAGMETEAWQRPDTTVYLFTSEKFSD